jgi:4-amino-4-deoxy-L-arabinose transferase-like glycosyltransferase
LSKKSLALLAFGAIAVRLAYLLAFARHYQPASDAHHYQTIATAVADGDGLSASFPFAYVHPTAFRPPLYPALLGALYWIMGVHIGAGQLLNVALGAVVVILAAVLGAHIAGRRGGIAAGIAVAVYPPLLANDVVLLSEPLSLALLLGVILLLVHDRPAWAGLACGLLMLTRPSAQLLVVVLVAWLVWRAGWRAAVRFGAVSVVVVTPWIVHNWVLVGSPTLVTSNGFNLVSTYSAEAQASDGFADAVFDERFTRINQDNRNEVELDAAYREHAVDAVRDHPSIPLHVLANNLSNYFEVRPGESKSAEQDDGRNITFRNVTLPLFYVVTVAGIIGLWRARRRRGAELLLLEAAYFTVASIGIIAVPRLRAPFDLAAAIGTGLLAAQLFGRRAPEPLADTTPRPHTATWSRSTRILVALAVIAAVIAAASGIAVARNRVQDNGESQLRRTLDHDGRPVQRLARFDAANLIIGASSPSDADFERAQAVADRLWLLSPRLSSGSRTEGRDAARALDEAVLELRVLDLVTSGNRVPGASTVPPEALDASRVTYETRIRPDNARLPDWDTLSANTRMRQVARDLRRLHRELSR